MTGGLMSGRFGQYEGEAVVRAEHPTHAEDPPPRYRTMQFLVVLAVVIVLGAVACYEADTPRSDPDLRGVVTASDDSRSILVVWTADPAIGPRAAYDAASVRIDPSTGLERAADVPEVSHTDVGAIVEVWFSGPVAESYPVQATADWILVTGVFDGELPVPQGLQP